MKLVLGLQYSCQGKDYRCNIRWRWQRGWSRRTCDIIWWHVTFRYVKRPFFFSARCNIYISRYITSRAYATMSVSVCLSVTEVHWRIIANVSFKLRSHFTAHCGRSTAAVLLAVLLAGGSSRAMLGLLLLYSWDHAHPAPEAVKTFFCRGGQPPVFSDPTVPPQHCTMGVGNPTPQYLLYL